MHIYIILDQRSDSEREFEVECNVALRFSKGCAVSHSVLRVKVKQSSSIELYLEKRKVLSIL